MADSSRLIHPLPLPHPVAGAAVLLVGEEDAAVAAAAAAPRDLIPEGVGGTAAAVAGVEIDSPSLLRRVAAAGKGGDTSPSRTVAGMKTAAREGAAVAAVAAGSLVIADVVSRFGLGSHLDEDLRPHPLRPHSGTNAPKGSGFGGGGYGGGGYGGGGGRGAPGRNEVRTNEDEVYLLL